MTLESKTGRLHADQVIAKVLYPEATVSLTVNDQVVRASTVSGGGGAFTITLPSVAEAKGRIYSLYMVARNSTEDITIQDLGDDAGFSDVTFNLAADQVTLYSDGFQWLTIASAGL